MLPEDAIALPPRHRGGRDHPRTALEAFGTVKSQADWVRDRRCRVGACALNYRLRRGWSVEDAIATLPFRPAGEYRQALRGAPAKRRRKA